MAQEDTTISGNMSIFKSKTTQLCDIMAADEVKVQSHSDFE